ncbi:MAG: hypothetical protein ACOX61_08280 [Brooklawnia sp.]
MNTTDALENLLHEIVARLSDIHWALIEIRDQGYDDTPDDDSAEDTP